MIFDIVTFTIAVLSFLLSVWNFIEMRWQNRVSLSVDCKDYLFADFLKTQPLFVGLTISNKSRLQISVTRLFITFCENTYEFSWIPMPVFNSQTTQSGNVLDSTIVKSLVPPLNLAGLASTSGYWAVSTHGNIDIETLQDSKANITLHTNRGIKSFTINLHQHSKDA